MKKQFIYWLLIFLVSPILLMSQDKETIEIPGLYSMPKKAQVISPSKSKAGVREDVHKFMGYEEVLPRYISIPYDTATNANFTDFFSDPGFVNILLLPLLFLLSGKLFSSQKLLLINLSTIFFCSVFLIISISSAFMNKHNLSTPVEALSRLDATPIENSFHSLSKTITSVTLQMYKPMHGLITRISGETDYITYPFLMVFFTLLLWLFQQRISSQPKALQSLLIFTSAYFLFWWILGAGISWYGLLLFCLPYFFILNAISKNAPSIKSFKTIGVLSICLIWIAFAFVFRSTNYSPISVQRAQSLYIPPILEYQTGNASKKKVLEANFPKVTEFQRIINQNEEGRVYRVGTQLKFFINQNDKRVFDDTFLDFFEEMVQKLKDKQQIVKGLKLNGFEYILLDLNMANGDYTPEKSLSRKFTNFMNSLYGNPAVELVLTDRLLKLENGQVVSRVFPENASIVNPGRMALFRIK